MRSFRVKTVLLSVLLCGTLLMVTGVLGWRWLVEEFQASLDAKIVVPGQRITEYHGWRTDWKHFEKSIDAAVGDGWRGDRILKVRSNMYERDTLYRSENWPDGLPLEDIPGFDEMGERKKMMKHGEKSSFARFPLLGLPHLYTAGEDGTRWRVATLSNPELTLYIGINLDRYYAKIRGLRTAYFGTLVLVVLGIGFGAYWISTRALNPVEAIATAARGISSKELSHRVLPQKRYDQEFDSLIAVINEMIDRLAVSFGQAMRFSADASHELKTPLTIIQSEISTRLQKCDTDSEEQNTLNRLMEELECMKRIIRGLFLLSEADAGKMPLTFELYDFSEQLESFARDTEILAEELGLETQTEIEPGIEVRADQMLIRQVVQNLVSNAMRHNVSGGFVRWRLVSLKGGCLFRIENSGPPILEDDQAHIFDRFYRGERTRKSKTPGLGLGLSLAKEIIAAHRGSLELVKSDEESTCFELRLNSNV